MVLVRRCPECLRPQGLNLRTVIDERVIDILHLSDALAQAPQICLACPHLSGDASAVALQSLGRLPYDTNRRARARRIRGEG